MIQTPQGSLYEFRADSSSIDLSFQLDKQLGAELNDRLNRAQMFLDSEVLRYSMPFIPFQTGNFQRRTEIINKPLAGTGLVLFPGPFARFLWHGMLMVGIDSGSAWAKSGESKVVTSTPLTYNEGPRRGAKWTQRAWEAHKAEILDGTQKVFDNK